MKTLIAVGNYVLARVNCGILPYCWYQDFEGYKAKNRNDGLIYIGGFTTQAKAEAWGIKQGYLPQDYKKDFQ